MFKKPVEHGSRCNTKEETLSWVSCTANAWSPIVFLTQTLKQPNEGIEMSLWQPGTTINVINVTFYITLKIIEPTV